MARTKDSRPAVLPSGPGTYGLLLNLPHTVTLQVGQLGEISFPIGFYLYIGSALGSGGLRARVRRHLRTTEIPILYWHIDRLLQEASPREVWLCAGDERLECVWAHSLHRTGVPGIPGFGASDCDCPSHLFRLETRVLNSLPHVLYCPDRPEYFSRLGLKGPARNRSRT